MGANGTNLGISRRAFLLGSAAAGLGVACGGSPAGQVQDPVNRDPELPLSSPAQVGVTARPPQQGDLGFQSSHLIDMPSVPAPSGIHIGDSEARVVSSMDLGGLPGMKGLFRFAVPGANSSLSFNLGVQNSSYLNDVAVLSDNGSVITAVNGIYHNSAFKPFPYEREMGEALFPGAAVLTNVANAQVLWVTLSVFNGDRFMSQQDPYLNGALLAYPVISGDLDTDAVEIIPMSGQNSTAIGLRNSGTHEQLLILNSGNYRASSKPSIDIVSAVEASHLGTIELPSGFTAQASTRLALSEDGENVFVGTADESRRVFKVGIRDGNVSQAIVEAAGFHSSVVLNGGFIYVTSYHHEQSFVTVLDQANMSHIETIDLGAGKAGMSAAYSGGLVQLMPHKALFIEPVQI